MILALVAVATTIGLLVREPIAARAIDWIGKRIPPDGAEFDVDPHAPLPRSLARRVLSGDARVLNDGGVVHVSRGTPLGKPLVCPPCMAWWSGVALGIGAHAVGWPFWWAVPFGAFVVAKVAS